MRTTKQKQLLTFP